jgi:lipid-A-disaccharide synthase
MARRRSAGRLTIGLVAGEVSGDQLGGALIHALREKLPGTRFVGLTGEHMRAAGCDSLGSCEELAVMGLVEPLRHLPRLLKLRARLRREFLARSIDVFVGVDAPAFNLGLARWLRSRGIAAAQYVSPQVWAWRPGRIPGIARSVDAVLCLLPFEPRCYEGHPVKALFVGHPLADRIALQSTRVAARLALGLAPDESVVAVLPGSRRGEVMRLGEDFAAACAALAARANGPLKFISPMASPALAQIFKAQVASSGASIRLLEQQADLALAAADVALVASGTATLQAMLHGCPMVVAYRLAPLTAFLVRDMGLVKLEHFSLPNLLAGESLVPEFFQEKVTASALAQSLSSLLQDVAGQAALRERFSSLHQQLRQDSARKAAQVVIELARDAAA